MFVVMHASYIAMGEAMDLMNEAVEPFTYLHRLQGHLWDSHKNREIIGPPFIFVFSVNKYQTNNYFLQFFSGYTAVCCTLSIVE